MDFPQMASSRPTPLDNHRYIFAVRITPAPRKTRFRLLVRLYRAGFPPARFLQKVSNSRHVCYPPLPSFRGARSGRY
jgi:hypothetical protein